MVQLRQPNTTIFFTPAVPDSQQPATQDNEDDPDASSLFPPTQGPTLTAIVDTALALVLITFITVCFLQWRSGRRRQRRQQRREDLERECRDHQYSYAGPGPGSYAGPPGYVEVPLEELRGMRVEGGGYGYGEVNGRGRGYGERGGGRGDGNDTAETGSSLGGGIERCERESGGCATGTGTGYGNGNGNGNGHGEGDAKGPYRFEEVAVRR
ncbi:hypothetical protein B0T09DRAFT_159000 [Sordaria sp. MPI-SDFR-AT-0083]|nr:hypothetical protein B0T09DRAFT_159000 [Sordaria sp. MPI-SDFR-AT-0083]